MASSRGRAAASATEPRSAAGHEIADLLHARGSPGAPAADDAAAEEHDQAIGEREQLVEVLRDQQDAGAGVARLPGAARGRPPRCARRGRAWDRRRRSAAARAPARGPGSRAGRCRPRARRAVGPRTATVTPRRASDALEVGARGGPVDARGRPRARTGACRRATMFSRTVRAPTRGHGQRVLGDEHDAARPGSSRTEPARGIRARRGRLAPAVQRLEAEDRRRPARAGRCRRRRRRPTISPGRIARSMSAEPARARRRRACSRRAARGRAVRRPAERGRRRAGRPRARASRTSATTSAASRGLARARGCPPRRPRRITVMRSAPASTSGSLWAMKTTA